MRRECFLWFMQEQEGTTWNNCMIIMNDHDILKVAFIRLPPSARLIGLELKTSSEDLPSELMKLLERLAQSWAALAEHSCVVPTPGRRCSQSTDVHESV